MRRAFSARSSRNRNITISLQNTVCVLAGAWLSVAVGLCPTAMQIGGALSRFICVAGRSPAEIIAAGHIGYAELAWFACCILTSATDSPRSFPAATALVALRQQQVHHAHFLQL